VGVCGTLFFSPTLTVAWTIFPGVSTSKPTSKSNIVIVPANIPQDLQRIQACRAQAFERPVTQLLESQQTFVNATRVAKGQAVCWLAQQSGTGGVVWGTADVVQKAGDQAMTINNVFVTPDARGQGLATRLLAAIEQDARSKGVKLLALEVYTGNTPAYSLYLQNEFTTRGIHNVMEKLAKVTGFSFLVRMEKELGVR
jgi:GNAT superfamily N-acetyltransferase